VLDVMRGLGRDGRTLVFTTHDPNLAAAIADHVVLLRDGRILAASATAAAMTAEALSATYGVEVEIVEVRGRPLVITR
jgi:iron complex transport system ATP-binding protein